MRHIQRWIKHYQEAQHPQSSYLEMETMNNSTILRVIYKTIEKEHQGQSGSDLLCGVVRKWHLKILLREEGKRCKY